MDLECRIDDTDDAYQHHETRGKEVDNEFQGVLKIKTGNECLDAKHEKKKRYHRNQDILSPPKTRAHRTYLLDEFRLTYPYQDILSSVFVCFRLLGFSRNKFQCLVHLKGKYFAPAGKEQIVLEQRFLSDRAG